MEWIDENEIWKRPSYFFVLYSFQQPPIASSKLLRVMSSKLTKKALSAATSHDFSMFALVADICLSKRRHCCAVLLLNFVL
jgi:hypothetical protein